MQPSSCQGSVISIVHIVFNLFDYYSKNNTFSITPIVTNVKYIKWIAFKPATVTCSVTCYTSLTFHMPSTT